MNNIRSRMQLYQTTSLSLFFIYFLSFFFSFYFQRRCGRLSISTIWRQQKLLKSPLFLAENSSVWTKCVLFTSGVTRHPVSQSHLLPHGASYIWDGNFFNKVCAFKNTFMLWNWLKTNIDKQLLRILNFFLFQYITTRPQAVYI